MIEKNIQFFCTINLQSSKKTFLHSVLVHSLKMLDDGKNQAQQAPQQPQEQDQDEDEEMQPDVNFGYSSEDEMDNDPSVQDCPSLVCASCGLVNCLNAINGQIH